MKPLEHDKLVSLYKDNPTWVVYNYPEWVAEYDTELMLRLRPNWMIFNRMTLLFDKIPHIMALQYPNITFDNNPAIAYEHNPTWVLENHPEYVCIHDPDRMVEYKPSLLFQYNPKWFYDNRIDVLVTLPKPYLELHRAYTFR